MAEIQWWYARGDEQSGPVSAAELRRLASTGALAPGDLVWREGLAEWAPAARLKGLFPEGPTAGAPAAATPAGAAATGAAAAGTAAMASGPAAAAATLPREAGRMTAEAEKGAGLAAAMGQRPPLATQETAELPPDPPSDPGFASFVVVDQPPVEPPVDMPPPPPPPTSAVEVQPVVHAPSGRQRISHLRLVRILRIVQGALWATCVLVILFGGLVFTWVKIKGKDSTEQAAWATIFGMFFIGAYVIARAGEKISQLVLAHLEQRRG